MKLERKTVSGMMLAILTVSMLPLAFNIQSVRASGTVYIRADGSVDPPTAPIQYDGDLYIFTDNIYDSIVVERDNIVVDGAGFTAQGMEADGSIGVDLSGRTNVTIKDMTVKAFDNGIQLFESLNIRISGSKITSNKGYGIMVGWSSSNNIVENIISNNNDGILIGWSSGNTVYGNDITANRWHGVWLSPSSGNIIYGNNIIGNDRGIGLDISSNNIIYHNNFVNNVRQVHDASWDYPEIFDPSINIWDDGYPSGGNYWSDYAGVDSNEDGTGDTPYVIDGNNQDRYPLMSPWKERTVGVKVGDWAKYNVGVNWAGVLDPIFSVLSETRWLMIEATDILGTEVTFTGTLHFKNDTEQVTTDVTWDIAPTGSYGILLFFIGSNLQAGDKIYPSSISTINETVTRTYNGVPRENNHLNVSTSYALTPPPAYDIYRLDCYWDKATGILTEETQPKSIV